MYILAVSIFLGDRIPFSDLEFDDQIGSGSYGTVYKGKWMSKGLQVAIKCMVGRIRKEEVNFVVLSNSLLVRVSA